MRINGRQATPEQARRLGTIFVVVGIVVAVLFVAGTGVARLTGPDRGSWVETAGTVTGNVASNNVDIDQSAPDTLYQRDVTYTADGREYTAGMGRETSSQWETGQPVSVVYDPADPTRAELQGETATVLLVVGGAGLAFGLLFAGVGLAIRLSARG